MLYFATFIFYVSYTIDKRVEEQENNIEDKYFDLNLGFRIATIVFLSFFLFVEVMEVWFHKLDYFFDFWNILDLASLGMNISIVVLDWLERDEATINAISSVAVLLIWFKLFYFLRIFFRTAHLIWMIIEIVWDMRYFVLVLFIAVVAFANTFYVLGENSDPGSDWFSGNNFILTFIFSYRMGLGDFETDGFNTWDEIIIWILWFLNTLLILIILLNLIIALMGDTYARV